MCWLVMSKNITTYWTYRRDKWDRSCTRIGYEMYEWRNTEAHSDHCIPDPVRRSYHFTQCGCTCCCCSQFCIWVFQNVIIITVLLSRTCYWHIYLDFGCAKFKVHTTSTFHGVEIFCNCLLINNHSFLAHKSSPQNRPRRPGEGVEI